MAEVTDNALRRRYEMVADGATAYVTYVRHGNRLTLVHTEVPKALSGRGVGSSLATAVLEEVRRRGRHVAVECEFLEAFINRHPEFADLVIEDDAP